MSDIKNNIETLEKIAKIIKENELSEISVESGDLKICVKAAALALTQPQGFAYGEVIAQSAREAIATANAEIRGNVVKSPIIGTFYASPAPDKSAFASIGDRVERGQVVCIVESMKLMNEITSEFSGVVTEIYVNDGDPVEFDQKLMRIE